MQVSKKLTGCVSTNTPAVGFDQSRCWSHDPSRSVTWWLADGLKPSVFLGEDWTVWCFHYCYISSYQLILLYSSLETRDPHPLSLLLTILLSRSIEFSSQLSVFLWQKTADNRAISLDGRTAWSWNSWFSPNYCTFSTQRDYCLILTICALPCLDQLQSEWIYWTIGLEIAVVKVIMNHRVMFSLLISIFRFHLAHIVVAEGLVRNVKVNE